MCGRYTLASGPDDISDLFKGRFHYPEIPKSYNIAPSQKALIVTLGDGGYRGEMASWGLVPHWMRDARKPFINARSETVLEKPSFRYLFKGNRCVVPADGFYEWMPVGGRKRPVYFHRPGRNPFAFAGFWEKDRDEEGSRTFVVMTTSANGLVSRVHDRMPVILGEDGIEAWLEDGDREVLAPAPDDLLVYDYVSPLVNSPANNSDACIRAVEDES